MAKIKKVKPITKNEFEQEQPISGGDLYNQRVALKTAEAVLKSTFTGGTIDSLKDDIEDYVKKYISDSVPHWWTLLQEQANYFCNQFNWNIDDNQIKKIIVNVIRCSFYNGIGGLYYNDITQKFEAVALSNMEYNNSGEIIKAKYNLAHQYLLGINEQEKYEFKGEYNIPESKIENLAVFKWGTEGLHAWIRLMPYVKNQHTMMKMLTIQKFAYNKKFIYHCNSPTAAKKELELYFNPENPFIVNASFGTSLKELENEFGEIQISKDGALDFIQFYKEMMGIIYSQIGRRQNVDTKKERNVSNEVEASQENYDILFNDVNRQFNIFCTDANEILRRVSKPEIQVLTPDTFEKMEEDNNDEIQRDNSEDSNQRNN